MKIQNKLLLLAIASVVPMFITPHFYSDAFSDITTSTSQAFEDTAEEARQTVAQNIQLKQQAEMITNKIASPEFAALSPKAKKALTAFKSAVDSAVKISDKHVAALDQKAEHLQSLTNKHQKQIETALTAVSQAKADKKAAMTPEDQDIMQKEKAFLLKMANRGGRRSN